jgi:hypothetical protein
MFNHRMITLAKINGLSNDHVTLPPGRQCEYWRVIAEFKASAKMTYLSQKRQSYQRAIRDFVKLNNVTEYYCCFVPGDRNGTRNGGDDSFEVWYKSRQ